MYARAWESDYEQPFFDAEIINETPPKSTESPVQSDVSAEEMRKTPGTANDCFREIFPQMDEFSDVTDRYPQMEPDVEATSEQPETSPANRRSSKYNLYHNPKPNCNDDYKF